MCQVWLENIDTFDQVVIDDVDKHALEPSDNTGTLLELLDEKIFFIGFV